MIPAELIARRTALGLSQFRLAQALGVSTNPRQRTSSTIWRWENGERAIPGWVPPALERIERERTAATA